MYQRVSTFSGTDMFISATVMMGPKNVERPDSDRVFVFFLIFFFIQ